MEEHPEDICQKCGNPNIVWFTTNALWNKVVEDKPARLCPVCFVEAAEKKGIKPTGWFLTEEAEPRMMEEFKFTIGCSLGGWYCDIRQRFFGENAEDAKRKAKAYVETLAVREEMMEDERS